ncbi:MAG: hypothetical protein KC635_01870 [Myxococcales bacterium]|nr:hypothetical protein [Myxococcales bacterium]
MLLTSAVLAAALTMGLGACGDDGETTGTTDTVQNDTSTTDSTTTDTSTGDDTNVPDTSGDTTVADPCTPNPCTNPPAATCDDMGMVVTYGATGTCTANGSAAECAYTSSMADCDSGKVCAAGACVEAGDPCEYSFDEKASVVTEIRIASLAANGADGNPTDHCCFDFTDDGKIDNKLGSILKTVGSLVGDLNGTIKEQVDGGSLVILLEEKGVDDTTSDSSVSLNGFLGDPVEGTKTGAEADGMGTFTASNSSFLPGTATPLISFQDASIAASVLAGGPTVFTLSLPLLEGAPLVVQISMTRLEGKVSTGPNGKGLDIGAENETDLGAKLGGVITLTDLYSAVNTFVAGSCVTVTDADNKLVSLGTDGKWKCASTTASGGNPAEVDTSACDDNDPAKQLAGFCSALVAVVGPDVDTDEDGTKDAISIGLWVNATSATITSDPTCTANQ